MTLVETPISGLKILEPRVFEDTRGRFIKSFNNDFFQSHGLDIHIKEAYYSISHENVIRGMHFQTPPHDHLKIVYVPHGRIIDVVLDIRKNSPTFGDFFALELSAQNAKALIIPRGLAHGFRSMENNTNVTYLQTSCYMPDHDFGIRYDSFGYEWGIDEPRLSERDAAFVPLAAFDTPFVFGHIQ